MLISSDSTTKANTYARHGGARRCPRHSPKIIRCQKTDTCVCLFDIALRLTGFLVSYAKSGYLDRCPSRPKELDKN